jgi:hypothetical protein
MTSSTIDPSRLVSSIGARRTSCCSARPLADLSNSFEVIGRMRYLPMSLSQFLALVGLTDAAARAFRGFIPGAHSSRTARSLPWLSS